MIVWYKLGRRYCTVPRVSQTWPLVEIIDYARKLLEKISFK
jgi:hypothetical protein